MRVVVGRVADFNAGDRVIIHVGERSIGVFRVHGSFYAIRNRCPHAGGPLCLGRVQPAIESPAPGTVEYVPDKTLLACPWHGWEYDLATGQSYTTPKLRVRHYPVSIECADETGSPVLPDVISRMEGERHPRLVEGPYKAETFPVSVEQEFIFVDIPGG